MNMIIISILVLLSSVIIAYLYYYVIHLARFRRLLNLIPGPPMIPFIGDPIILFQRTREELFQIFQLTRGKKYGPIWKLQVFVHAVVSINHPDDVQTITTNMNHNTKGNIYKFLQPWLGDGLLLSKGAKWQERRKILTPTFHFNILKSFFDVLIEESNRMTKFIKDMDDPTMKDLTSFISHHTLNIISETSMGTSLQTVSELEQKQYRKAILDMGDIIFHRMMRPWLYLPMLFELTPTYRKQVKCLKILHGFTEKIIAERKQYHQATGGRYLNFENDAEHDKKIGGRKKRLAMLDHLILASNNNQMSDLDIREEVSTFMFEGHDTVAMTLTYTILLLAEHKEVQDRIRNEVNAVMEENEGKLTMTALQNLSYMERCLKESMRLYPSVFSVTRLLEEDVKLQSYVVPAGVEVHIDFFNLHRNPEFWPNPEAFDPDRFLPELVKDRHPFAFLPFSAGSRNCIGQRFAMMELKIVIATLLRNFYLEPVSYLKDLRIIDDIILRPAHPLCVKFVQI